MLGYPRDGRGKRRMGAMLTALLYDMFRIDI